MALLDYLTTRRGEIEAQMKALKAELAEIRIAEEALVGGQTTRTVMSGTRGSSTVRAGSIKDWIMKALMQASKGLETDEVIEAVTAIGGPTVLRNSMTPQLSRLKGAGLIEQEGRLWRLVSHNAAQNDEALGVQPPSAPEDEDYSDLV
jgi:hypothetical protein